ncbi:MAG: sugar ABC transporter ATP-binding protein [Spirochaetaceae bacterium]|nr:sugar ABC transporter ATP-binding protein [Spirochaetaceae bacterium]
MPGKILQVKDISKTFGFHKALDKVSFSLEPGEIHCLVGENGAGKSTFIKILSGAHMPDCGVITLNGKEFGHLNPREAMLNGISTIYQDVELIESLSVADNIFLGKEINKGSIVNYREQNRRARELMGKLNISIDETALVETLSTAKKQTLQIVKAIHSEAKILIMDEPTSSLGYEETRALMDMIRELKNKGIGIIYISHYLEEIFEIGDSITILKDGKYIGSYSVKDITLNDVINKMVGRDASLFFKRERVSIGDPVLKIQNLSSGKGVKDISFEVREGEVFGIGGLVGAGRTELVNLIFGVDKVLKGSMLFHGKGYAPGSPKSAMKSGVCMISEDRKKSALFPERSLIENIVLVDNELKNNHVLKISNEMNIVRRMIEKLNINASDINLPVSLLSGGNQQKTVIARWLLSEMSLFIFDEPSKGVDIGSREGIYKLIVELVKNGKAVIMISSDMPELISISDRIGVMREGKMTNILDAKDAKEEELIKMFIGEGCE